MTMTLQKTMFDEHKFILRPGEVRSFNKTGEFVYAMYCTGKLHLKLKQDDKPLEIVQGRGFEMHSGEWFTQFWITNPSENEEITATLFSGYGKIIDFTLQAIDETGKGNSLARTEDVQGMRSAIVAKLDDVIEAINAFNSKP